MKKLFLIALIGASAVYANAQSPFNTRHDNVTHRNDPFAGKATHDLDRRIAAINTDYNNRINSVKHQPFLRKGEKRRKIRDLEKQRKIAISQCRDNFSRPYDSGFNRNHR